MAKVFFSYSHDDEQFRNQLEKHLSMLQHQGLIEPWHDRRITAGAAVDDAISNALEEADIILLLVSASFIASAYCYSREMERAMQRHRDGTAVVIPVIVRMCDWHPAPFGKLLAVPKDGKAIDLWANFDEAYTDVARQIRTVVEKRAFQSPASSCTVRDHRGEGSPSPAVPSSELPRSSNLRLKKEFTDHDRDRFLSESFEYLSRFFQGSLKELADRNPGIEGKYQQIDATKFTATIYRNGKKINECAINLGGGGFSQGVITFSYDASARSNSFNESVSVETDDQALFFKPLGMDIRNARESHLSQEGAAELFWGMLIAQLQK
ncbi:MAG: toll/interleukin-1 receptor domain-containing protein [Polaromonas sp.]|uniref:toll/interleukin-1 receptor domain-containing protein n=1 Tax=Polaromonas sp. TaxID=1869339 RepID=UPI002488C715|nr:toll/interleukin-1 receptor domain-containing protein [Polaromonas sp.]MDI1268337.1 toll/interleukin-1 receptor domain-containing protein [Polaromonas sp.]